MEAIKLIAAVAEPPLGKLTYYDALTTRFRSLNLSKNPSCLLCGDSPTITSPISYIPTPCSMSEISVTDLAALLEADWTGQLIDVRQPEEWEEAHIDQAKLVPLSELPQASAHWDKEADYIIHCKSGMRSAKAQAYLLENGFKNVRNTIGGIEAWLDAGL